MTHEEARELLLDLSYGELDPALRRQVETHVSGCTDCEAELEALASTRAAARAAARSRPSRGREELVEAARRAAASRSFAGRRPWARPAAWMATAALVLVVGGVTMRLLDARTAAVVGAGAGRRQRSGGADREGGGRARIPPPRAEAPPAKPSAAPPGALASRETADSPERAAKRSRQDAPAPVAEASGSGPGATAGARPREARDPADFPPGTTGSFVSLDLRSGEHFRVNAAGCATRHSPYSTFKIPSSLIGLETGVVADPDQRWRWDATRYPPPSPAPGGEYLRAWQQDQSLRTALPRSIVWYFREVASEGRGAEDEGMARHLRLREPGHLGRARPLLARELAADLPGRAGRVPGEAPARTAPGVEEEPGSGAGTAHPGVGPHLPAHRQDRLVGGRGGVARRLGRDAGRGLHVRPAPGCAEHEEMVRIRPGLARDFLRRAGCLPR